MFSPGLEKGFKGMFAAKRAKHIEELVADVNTKARSPLQTGQSVPAPSQSAQDNSTYARKRIIRREWPRDPNGPVLKGAYGDFKMAGNELPLWGATVLDFFRTMRIPTCPNLSTITTGSKMLAFVKSVGELEHAKDEISWAEEEAQPVEIMPYDMATMLRDFDHGVFEHGPIKNGVFSQFHNRIPMHLLPEKLLVHDPDNTLCVHDRKSTTEKRVAPRVYRLSLSEKTRKAIEAKREEIRNASKKENPGLTFVTRLDDPALKEILDPDNVFKDGQVPEATIAQLPPYPDEPLSTPEAHLYLSARQRLGKGNHSVVYRAEFEIPRSLVEEPTICNECAHDAFLKKLQSEMPGVQTNPDLPVGWQIENLLMAAAREHKRTGKMWTEYKEEPAVLYTFAEKGKEDRSVPVKKGVSYARQCYEGGSRKVNVDDVKYTMPGSYCEHQSARQGSPTTFRVRIAAKLSFQHDHHLEREAKNYQNFPDHFFQHWSGYNVVPPLHDPTPVLAVVPQFHGYYVPEENDEEGRYISPIMLIEDCGVPVEINELNIDERQECAALYFRLHFAGWLHNSVAPRNVTVDYGDIHDWPAFQSSSTSKVKRFRLIDFGRSEYDESDKFSNNRANEEWEVQRLLKVANGTLL